MLVQEVSSFFAFFFVVGLGFISNYFVHRMDVKPLRRAHEGKQSGQFVAERAYDNLKILNDFGPKVVGSDANEIKAFNFIWDELTKVKNSSDTVTIDHQIASSRNYRRHMYKNIQNIVVRFQGHTDHALMLNCHFDSVPGSPGASDDAVMCCIMIEILRVLKESNEKPKHSIIFLFNGSEEEGLQASHGFITQHRWAKDVRAYINLESTGSDGRAILFRSGPKHDWLIRLYRQSVPRPFGHSFAEELFETGVIPASTDFDAFSFFGGIPGLDFAFVDNGWRYHTRYDSVEYISMESVQHTGENILELTKKLANSEELENPPEGSFAVYYDYLGIFFISYSKEVGIGLNISISVLAFFIPFLVHIKSTSAEFVAKETLFSVSTLLGSTILSAVVCYLLALIMNAADNTMSWFNTTFISIGIYGSAAVATQIATYQLIQFIISKTCKKEKLVEKKISVRHQMKVHFNGVNLFWMVITIAVTAMGYRFGYIFMNILVVSLATNILTYLSCKVLPTKKRPQSWILIHLLGHAFIFLWLCYMMILIWQLFIPITAKQNYPNPDFLVAMICCLWSVLCLSYFIPLTLFIKYRAVLYSVLITVFTISMILSFTSVGFPYSDDKVNPRLQRFRIIHSKRTFYDSNGSIKSSHSGFLFSDYDRNGERTLESSYNSNELLDPLDDEMCKSEAYCGFPAFNFGRYVNDSSMGPTVKSSKFTLLNVTRSSENPSQVYVEFSIDYTTLTTIYITPGEGWSYVNGSLQTADHLWNDVGFRSIEIIFGKKTGEVSTEYILLENLGAANKSKIVTISVVTQESVFEKSEAFAEIMKKMPDYTFSMEHQSDTSSYDIKEL